MTENMNQNQTTEMAIITPDIPSVDMLATLSTPAAAFFSSIKDDGSRESRIKIYNAVNSSDQKIDDHIGEVFNLRDVVAHPVRLVDEKTGEVTDSVRTILIMEDGSTYAAVSEGIVGSLSKLFAIVGAPTYEPALPITVKKLKTRRGYYTNVIEIV